MAISLALLGGLLRVVNLRVMVIGGLCLHGIQTCMIYMSFQIAHGISSFKYMMSDMMSNCHR